MSDLFPPKGRCIWVNLAEKPVGEFDEDEEEEEKEVEADEPEPEVGPPLLTPLSEDAGQPTPSHISRNLLQSQSGDTVASHGNYNIIGSPTVGRFDITWIYQAGCRHLQK